MYKAAMQCIYSQLAREERLFIINEPSIVKPKTKELIEELKGYKGGKRLIISLEIGDMVELASRNIRDLKILASGQVDPLSLLYADFTYLSENALKNIEESLA